MLLVANAPKAFQGRICRHHETEVRPARSKLISLARQPSASFSTQAALMRRCPLPAYSRD